MLKWTEKTVAVNSLKPYERNPRHATKEAYQRLKASIEELGFHQRIIYQPDLGVIGGHLRIKALKELGFKEVQVLVPSEKLTEEQFRRLLIQDNLPFGGWDFDILAADFDVGELTEWGFDADLLPQTAPLEGLTDPDDIPELTTTPVSKAGDVWLLGAYFEYNSHISVSQARSAAPRGRKTGKRPAGDATRTPRRAASDD